MEKPFLHIEQNIHSKQFSLEKLRTLIYKRVSELIHTRPDLLFSYCYRLDISEILLKNACNCTEPIDKITLLILERQSKRMKTKRQFFSHLDPEFDELKW